MSRVMCRSRSRHSLGRFASAAVGALSIACGEATGPPEPDIATPQFAATTSSDTSCAVVTCRNPTPEEADRIQDAIDNYDDQLTHCVRARDTLQYMLNNNAIKIYVTDDSAGGYQWEGWYNPSRYEIGFADSLFIWALDSYINEIIGEESDHAGNWHTHTGASWGTTYGPSHFEQFSGNCIWW